MRQNKISDIYNTVLLTCRRFEIYQERTLSLFKEFPLSLEWVFLYAHIFAYQG